jgi:hypothetical protein
MAKPSLHLLDDAVKERFWERFSFRPNGECWEWPGRRDAKGYGVFWAAKCNWRSHRIALFFKTGEMPSHLMALHACDNPPCCNPEHLRWGTHQENQQDKVDRGGIRGVKNGRAKISRTDADFIAATDRPTSQLMEWFGLSKGQINKIRRGEIWLLQPPTA